MLGVQGLVVVVVGWRLVREGRARWSRAEVEEGAETGSAGAGSGRQGGWGR